MSDDTLRDELVETLYRHRVNNAAATIEDWPGEDQSPLLCRVLRHESEAFADVLLPVVRRHIEQARAEQVRPLMPAEHMVYTVARNQIRRGDNPPLNTTAGLLMTVERLAGIEQADELSRLGQEIDT